MALKSGKNLLNYAHYENKKGQSPKKEIECSIMIFDVVDFSKKTDNERMIEIVDIMHDRLFKLLEKDYFWAEKDDNSDENTFLLIPTGDGYGLALSNLEKDEIILDIAGEIFKIFNKDNKFKFRMGVAKGQSVLALDLNGNLNVFGYGIVLATRVCSSAKPGQILVHQALGDSLLQKRTFPGLKMIDEHFETKHDEKLKCYNFSGAGFGLEV